MPDEARVGESRGADPQNVFVRKHIHIALSGGPACTCSDVLCELLG